MSRTKAGKADADPENCKSRLTQCGSSGRCGRKGATKIEVGRGEKGKGRQEGRVHTGAGFSSASGLGGGGGGGGQSRVCERGRRARGKEERARASGRDLLDLGGEAWCAMASKGSDCFSCIAPVRGKNPRLLAALHQDHQFFF